MRKIVVAGIAMALLMAAGRSAWAIEWERDLEVAFIKAKADNKPVMVDFSTEWCGWCKKLDAEVYTDADVNKLAESFVSVKVDCGKDKQAAARYGLRGYPTIIFFDPQGVQAETIVGYRDAGTFAGIMDKVLVAMAPKPAVAEEKPAVVARAEKVRPEGQFELQGIMGKKAIINSKIVEEGDLVDQAKVIEIRENHVKLDYNGIEIAIGLCCPIVEADADTVYFKNGRRFSGIIKREFPMAVELETDAGTVLISQKSIKSIKRASPEAKARLRQVWAKSCVEIEKQKEAWEEDRQKRLQEYVDWLRHKAERRVIDPGSGKEISIERDPRSMAIVVSAVLDDNVKASLVVDTGADMIVLSKKIGSELGVDTLSDTGGEIRDIRVVGGKTVKAKIVVLKSVKVEDTEEKDVLAAVLVDDIENPAFKDGLLGRSFLNRFNILIDVKGMRMQLERLK